jgi:hypothetical protein
MRQKWHLIRKEAFSSEDYLLTLEYRKLLRVFLSPTHKGAVSAHTRPEMIAIMSAIHNSDVLMVTITPHQVSVEKLLSLWQDFCNFFGFFRCQFTWSSPVLIIILCSMIKNAAVEFTVNIYSILQHTTLVTRDLP